MGLDFHSPELHTAKQQQTGTESWSNLKAQASGLSMAFASTWKCKKAHNKTRTGLPLVWNRLASGSPAHAVPAQRWRQRSDSPCAAGPSAPRAVCSAPTAQPLQMRNPGGQTWPQNSGHWFQRSCCSERFSPLGRHMVTRPCWSTERPSSHNSRRQGGAMKGPSHQPRRKGDHGTKWAERVLTGGPWTPTRTVCLHASDPCHHEMLTSKSLEQRLLQKHRGCTGLAGTAIGEPIIRQMLAPTRVTGQTWGSGSEIYLSGTEGLKTLVNRLACFWRHHKNSHLLAEGKAAAGQDPLPAAPACHHCAPARQPCSRPQPLRFLSDPAYRTNVELERDPKGLAQLTNNYSKQGSIICSVVICIHADLWRENKFIHIFKISL